MFFDFVNYRTYDGKVIPFQRELSVDGKIQRQARCDFGTIDFEEQGYNSFSVWKSTCSFEQATTISFEEPNFTSFHIFFILKNSSVLRFEGLSPVTLPEHHAHCFFLPNLKGEYTFKKGEYMLLGIQLSSSQLEYYSERLLSLSPFTDSLNAHIAFSHGEPHAITPVLMLELHDLQHRNSFHEQRQLYMESKVANIVRLVVSQFDSAESPAMKKIHPSDIEKIREVREYILTHIQDPGSLSDLAHRAGINNFKLKDVFKKIYGNTVFGFLMEERLHRAKNWLIETPLAIKTISSKAGFKSVQHFSAAFRKKYGFPPSQLRREIKTSHWKV